MSQQTSNQPLSSVSPSTFHHRMVHLGPVEPIVTMCSPEGLAIKAFYVSIGGHIEYEATVSIAPDTRVHFVTSERIGWYYIVEHDTYRNRYTCTCKHSHCEHIIAIERQEEAKRRATYVSLFDPCGLGM